MSLAGLPMFHNLLPAVAAPTFGSYILPERFGGFRLIKLGFG